MDQFVVDSSDEDDEDQDPDIWSKNNKKIISSYVRKIAAPINESSMDFSKSQLRLDRRHNVMKHMVKSMNRKDVLWIKNNFMSSFCKCFVFNKGTGRCYCGRYKQEHRKTALVPAEEGNSPLEWSREQCIGKEPTNGLGRVLFDDEDHFASR